MSTTIKILYLFSDLFYFTFLIMILIINTILLKRLASHKKKFTFTRNLNEFTWFCVFLSSIFYFIMLLNSEPVYVLNDWDIHSNTTVHCLRVILTFLFLLYLIYLKTDLSNFIFYSYDFLIVLAFSFLSLQFILLSQSTLNLFIFIEIFSLTIYYLIASSKQNDRSLEASIKYYIFGSISSIFLLFGFYLLYLSTGTYKFIDIFLFTYNNFGLNTNFVFHAAILIISFSILSKIGASFFFFWLLDVYDGTNYPMLIYMNLFAKVAYIFVLFNIINLFNYPYLKVVVQILIVSSLFIGAINAIQETKVKRFLIFTSLYNIGFFSINFWTINPNLTITFLVFVFLYLFNSFIFMIIFFSIKDWNTNLTIRNLSDLLTLKYQNKALSYALIFFSAVNAGLPPLSLFFIKFTIFLQISRVEYFIWLIILLLASVLAFFYYIRLIKLLLQPTDEHAIFLQPIPTGLAYLISFSIFFNIFFITFYNEFYFFFFNA